MSEEASLAVPFICPHCDDDYYVPAEKDEDGDPSFDCPTCGTATELRGLFDVIGLG